MSDDILYGTSGDDTLSGGNGKDTIYGGDGNDTISGGNGVDNLFGDAGNDTLTGDNGADHLTGGADDDVLDGLSGFDTAYYSGNIGDYSFFAAAGYLHIVHLGGFGADGHDQVRNVERLVFADRVVDIGSGNNRPVAGDDHVSIDEDSAGASGNVLTNDFDFDGDALTVTGGTFTGTYGTLTLNSDGTYSYTLFASAQELAQGEIVADSFDYTVSDNDGSDTGTLVFHIAGVNDAPTANPDALTADENGAILIDVLANDTDVDNGAVLTVTAASAPVGQGTASVVGNQVEFDPGTDFDDLALGESEVVVVSYDIEDEHGATASSTVTITVTGANDDPVANPDTAATTENAAIAIDVLANDTDVDNGATLTVTAASAPAGQGSATVVGNQVEFDPGSDFDDLALGETEEVVVSYDIMDEHGATASSTITITVTGTNDGPVATPDTATTGENAAITVDVLANDTDVDNGATLTVTAASAPAGQGSATVVGNQVEFDPGTDFDALAVGESTDVVVSYDIEDEHGATDSSTLTITVTGTNDGPVANSESDTTSENATIVIDVIANDTDVDNGAVLTVTAASAPANQGTATVVNNQVEFDPGTDFDDLAVGESEVVVVSYDIEDEHGATASSTITITVTGTNDGPVANPDTRTTSEDSAVVIDVLANDTDVDHDAVLTVTAASAPAGQGTVTIVENQVRFDPGTDFDHLASGESAVVIVSYDIVDEHGATSSSTVTVTVLGRDEGASNTGTEGNDTLIGTPGNDTIDALGGDDTVFGLEGDDLIFGGNGNDFLNGDEDNDTIDGGAGEDVLAGGAGDDELFGQAGSDNISGEDGDDQLSGGDGFDQLFGNAGNDVLAGGNDGDFLSGGEGNDQLSGGAGDDGLDGGGGDDALQGGDGNDFLSDFTGTNSLAGGLGTDVIYTSSTDAAQTVDGGDGDDTIRHYFRHNASTITTGAGSDTIEIPYADQGTAAIIVTDFTAGAGGDVFLLSGDEGSLLSLLTGWDSSSNPFGSGFLRLVQNGADTLFQWDQDGETGGENWQTLVVFQGTTLEDFTEANFEPQFHPDGSAPAGETITGTAEDDVLIGTIGDDTIDALAGNDYVDGAAGADLIYGGDGSDQLYGGSGGDTIDGGNDDDYLVGGDGNDVLTGQAGNDNLVGESGDDDLTGGEGDDGLDGGEGDDTLTGGDGNDFLSGGLGTNTLTAGLGTDFIIADSTDGVQTIDGGADSDTIRHYYRHNASTITTGTGSDTIEIAHANQGTAAIVVTDFSTGAGGDVFRLTGDDGALLSLLTGWDGSSNPFGSGFLRLTQDGTDTLFQWDQDGAAGGENWETLVVFENTDADDFTEANFDPGYPPGGDPPAGETINGTAGDDTLFGTIGDDTINALGGNDFVFAGAGADLIYGGDGADQLRGEADDDTIEGGNDDDYLLGGDGNDTLSGQAGNDNLVGESGNDQLTGGDGDDGLDGGDGDDTLVGGAGTDYIAGGDGADVLTGGLDLDAFAFRTSSQGPDVITDFVSGTDKLYISLDGFAGLMSGGSVELVSGSDPVVEGANGQFLYDTDDGNLYWDSDGTGAEAAVLIATFSNLPSLETTDFVVL